VAQSDASTESVPSPTVADSSRPEPPPPDLARFGLALVFVAVGASAFAILFRSAVNVIFTRLYRASDVLDAFSNLPWSLRLLIPACGGGAAGLTGLWASRLFGGQGVGDVMEAVALGERHISLRLASLKAFGSWLAIVAGGSVGREGPIIQFGGGVGDATGHLFRLEERQTRALIAAGTAAGFAAAYNTPLAAVLFVVEVVAGVVALDTVLPAIIATPIATALTRLVVGGGPIYGERTFGVSSNVELLGHALLGLLAGIVGPAFMGLLEAGERVSARSSLPRPATAALGGLIVGTMAIWLPQVTGNGYEAINLILGGKLGIGVVVLLLAAKAFATTASVSSGSPGGAFTPSLFLGAALGGTVGRALAAVTPPGAVGPAGGYALVGMAALAAATTHAPVLAAVMVFELSGDYAIVLPLLAATGTATFVSLHLRRDSVYMSELRRRGKAWEITIAGRRMRRPS
jgi:CIC family chloride channel protein